MKYLLPILLVLTLVFVGCSNKQTNSTTASSNMVREDDNKIFCRQTFEAFQNPDETTVTWNGKDIFTDITKV